jgi:hypothetical protein
MGIYIYQLQTEFQVAAEKCPQMFEALKIAIGETSKDLLFGGERRGNEIVRHFAFINHEKVLNAVNLEEALYYCRWAPEFDQQGNIIDIEFTGEKYGNEDILFNALAPFIEEGSYITMVNDRREIWRWRFDGIKSHKETGKIIF